MYIHRMEYYSDVKKSEILTFMTTQMDPENVMLSKISQKNTIRFHFVWNLRKQTKAEPDS